VTEFGGKGNVETITNAIIQQIKVAGFDFKVEQFPWFYPSIGEYATLMEKAGFRVTFAMHFDRPTPLNGDEGLKNWITMFCPRLFDGIPVHTKDEMISNTKKQLKDVLFKDGQWIADYKRIRVNGIKP